MRSTRRNAVPSLDKWFSPARMGRFSFSKNPEKLYVWNTRLSKAFLEDIQHLEVLLRNRIDEAMTAHYGDSWMTNIVLYAPSGGSRSPGYDRPYSRNIDKARRRAGGVSATKGKIIAELSFDHWRFLLNPAKEQHIWRYLRLKLPHYDVHRKPRQLFEDAVDDVLKLRNRCAHHEPLARRHLSDERAYFVEAVSTIEQLARWIDPEASAWIQKNSRVRKLWLARPVDSVRDDLWIRRNPIGRTYYEAYSCRGPKPRKTPPPPPEENTRA